MKKIIAIANQKGGIGKSTTAAAIGQALASQGKKILFVDMDAQANLTYTLGAEPTNGSMIDVLMRKAPAAEILIQTRSGDLLPAALTLAGADMNLTETGKEYRLREALEPIVDQYDHIIIDTPPALGMLTVNALTAADTVVIPAKADIYSLQGVKQLYGTICAVRRYCNKELKIEGILLTAYNPRAVLNREIADAFKLTAESMETKLFDTFIREGIAVRESQIQQISLFEYAPKSNPAIDYLSLIDEMAKEE